MKTGDVIALLAALALIASIYFAKDIIPYIDKVWNAPKDCPVCEAQKPCPDCPPCKKSSSSSSISINGSQVIVDGEVVAGVKQETDSGIRRIYLPATATENVTKYKDMDWDLRRHGGSVLGLIGIRRKIVEALSKENLVLAQKLIEQCEEYEIYNGLDRPYIEFSNCGTEGTLKKTFPK